MLEIIVIFEEQKSPHQAPPMRDLGGGQMARRQSHGIHLGGFQGCQRATQPSFYFVAQKNGLGRVGFNFGMRVGRPHGPSSISGAPPFLIP